MHARPCTLDGLPCGFRVFDTAQYGKGNVFHPHGLKTRVHAGQRQHGQERLQLGEQVEEMVRFTEDDRGPQHGQVQTRGFQHRFTGSLGAQVSAGRSFTRAQGADMDHPPDTIVHACLRQFARQFDVNRPELSFAAMQYGHQVDHGVAATNQAVQLRRLMDICFHDFDCRQHLHMLGACRASRHHDHASPRAAGSFNQSGANAAPHKPRATQHQYIGHFNLCREAVHRLHGPAPGIGARPSSPNGRLEARQRVDAGYSRVSCRPCVGRVSFMGVRHPRPALQPDAGRWRRRGALSARPGARSAALHRKRCCSAPS